MVRAGILGEDDHVELIEGELLVMSPQDPPHAGAINRLTRRLVGAYGPGHLVRVQLPLHVSRHSLPEPDVVVARGDEAAFDARHPAGADAVLVVEASWSSRARDQRKAAIYARAGVPVYWRLDLETRQLEVHEQPGADGYARTTTLGEDDEVEAPGSAARWKVGDLLPAR